MRPHPLAACLLVGLLSSSARADVRLASIFGDHMVLQRNANVALWGTASPGELVRVRPSWYSNDAAVTAGPDGSFRVTLATPGEAGPHTIAIRGRNELTLRDVLLGEVWLASGQSNMEMGVGYLHDGYSGVLDWERELEDAARPRIRLFTVQNTAASAPQPDVQGIWRVADAATVKSFSATAWFFAKHLEQRLDAPIGVIAADWGGTPAEAWTSPPALGPFPRFAEALERVAKLSADPAGAKVVHERARGVWGRELARLDPLSAAHAEAPSFDDSGWEPLPAPGVWGGELAGFDGLLWMRRAIEVPAAWAGRELLLELGTIDDDERTWFDGEPVGATEGWTTPRSYRIAPALVHGGRVVIAVRVLDTGGAGGIRGEPAELRLAPVGGGDGISLAGEWRAARGAALADLPPKPTPFEVDALTPGALFQGMIAPLEGLRLAGFLWYQGESNVHRAAEYRELFPALIRDWRSRFGKDLPFLFVQIAPFGYGGDHGEAGDLREAQAAALALARTGMVVTLDAGDAADIHPKDKQTVGRRLADLALSIAYGRAAELPPAPAPTTFAVDASGGVTIEFDGEVSLSGPSAFELAGADGVFHPAGQTSVSARSVRVVAEGLTLPTAVRYAWGAAATPSLVPAGGGPAGEPKALTSVERRLPIAPFRKGLP